MLQHWRQIWIDKPASDTVKSMKTRYVKSTENRKSVVGCAAATRIPFENVTENGHTNKVPKHQQLLSIIEKTTQTKINSLVFFIVFIDRIFSRASAIITITFLYLFHYHHFRVNECITAIDIDQKI